MANNSNQTDSLIQLTTQNSTTPIIPILITFEMYTLHIVFMPGSYLEAFPDVLPRKTSRCQDPTAVLIWCHRWIELLVILLLLLFLPLLILKIQPMSSWDALGSSKSKDTFTTATSSQDPTAVLEVLVRCHHLPVTQTVQLWPSKNYPLAKNATPSSQFSQRIEKSTFIHWLN